MNYYGAKGYVGPPLKLFGGFAPSPLPGPPPLFLRLFFFFIVDESKIQSLTKKKVKIISIGNSKIEGVVLRSRCRYQDYGEIPTNYFFFFFNL